MAVKTLWRGLGFLAVWGGGAGIIYILKGEYVPWILFIMLVISLALCEPWNDKDEED